MTLTHSALAEINAIEKEKVQLTRDVERLQNSMIRLNKCIYEQRSSSDALEQENRFAEEDFVLRIREKETQAVEAEAQLAEAVREKEDLLADLLETEYAADFINSDLLIIYISITL